MSRVAICVPCWNQVQYTQWFVESVERNSGDHDVHFILLDNGSKDGTREYLRSVKNATRIFLPKNVGVNPAWNYLLREAQEPRLWRDDFAQEADVICLANNDILAGPEWLDRVCRELAKPDNASYYVANGFFDCDQHSFDETVRQALPELRGKRRPGRGGWCLFFTPAMVDLFLPIPPEIKLWFGDDWMHHKLGRAGYQCEALMDCCALHFLSKSVTEYPNKVEQIAQDREAFARIMEEEEKKA